MRKRELINISHFSSYYRLTRYCGDDIWRETDNVSKEHVTNPDCMYLQYILNLKNRLAGKNWFAVHSLNFDITTFLGSQKPVI